MEQTTDNNRFYSNLYKRFLGPVHTMSQRWAEPIPLPVFTVKFIYGTAYETKNFNWLEP